MYDGLRLYSSGFLILRGWMKNKEIAINSKNLISESYHTGHLGVGKVEKKKPYPDDTSYHIAYVECSRSNFCALITKGYWYFTLSRE